MRLRLALSVLASLASVLAATGCSDPELLDCAPGTWRQEGNVYGCLYESGAPAECPERAPHRSTQGGVVICATEPDPPPSLCRDVDGCGGAMDGGFDGGQDGGVDAAADADGDAGTDSGRDAGHDAASGVDRPAECGSHGDCDVDARCESRNGIETCFLPCATETMIDGGTIFRTDDGICQTEIEDASSCAVRGEDVYRCTLPCDVFDPGSCGEGLACDFRKEFRSSEMFAECRGAGTGTYGDPCPGEDHEICAVGYTCRWTSIEGSDTFHCVPLCDPSGDRLEPCPEGNTCVDFPRPIPGTSEFAGFCKPEES